MDPIESVLRSMERGSVEENMFDIQTHHEGSSTDVTTTAKAKMQMLPLRVLFVAGGRKPKECGVRCSLMKRGSDRKEIQESLLFLSSYSHPPSLQLAEINS